MAVTPTSPRVILLARVTLVFGYDLILALLSSAVLTLLNATPLGLTSLITTWLGPMAALSALSLLLSVCWNPEGATGVTLALWSSTRWPSPTYPSWRASRTSGRPARSRSSSPWPWRSPP